MSQQSESERQTVPEHCIGAVILLALLCVFTYMLSGPAILYLLAVLFVGFLLYVAVSSERSSGLAKS